MSSKAEPGRVRELLAEASATLATSDDANFQQWMTLFLQNLWEIQFGSLEDSEYLAVQLSELAEKNDDAITSAHVSEVYALRAHFGDEPEPARHRLIEAIGHYRKTEFRVTCFAHCLDHISLWALDQGDAASAATLLGSAEALRSDHVGSAAPAFEKVWHDQAKQRAVEELGTEVFDRRFQEGCETEAQRAADMASAVLIGA